MIFASRGMVLKGQHLTAVDQRDDFTRWMDVLLQRAEAIGAEGEVPVAAVILDGKGKAIGHGRNRRQNHMDPLGHAELVALRQAAVVQGEAIAMPMAMLLAMMQTLMAIARSPT